MPQRGYVLIFFFWALLTIITPTLVLWSASAKPNLDSQGEVSREIKARRMMGYMEKALSRNRTEITTTTMTRSPASAPVPAPVPASAPSPVPAEMPTRRQNSELTGILV